MFRLSYQWFFDFLSAVSFMKSWGQLVIRLSMVGNRCRKGEASVVRLCVKICSVCGPLAGFSHWKSSSSVKNLGSQIAVVFQWNEKIDYFHMKTEKKTLFLSFYRRGN